MISSKTFVLNRRVKALTAYLSVSAVATKIPITILDYANGTVRVDIPDLPKGIYPLVIYSSVGTKKSVVLSKDIIVIEGSKGDPFVYEDFTPEQLAALKGDDGYTPIKGVDYFDGDKGDDGAPGHTPVKGVDYFDGAKGDKGDPGYTPVKGVDYFDGADGYTPVKGVDYFDGINGSDATVTKTAVESVLTGEITTHTHPSSGLTQSQILKRQL